MTQMVYQWRPKQELPIDAQTAGEELERIRAANGGELDAAAVVDAAKQRKSPLHSAFEWNDGRAAAAYRLQQAGRLISSLIVTVTGDKGGAVTQDIAISVRRRPLRQGKASAKVISAEELAAERIKKGWTDLEHWLAGYGALPEFAPLALALQGFLAARTATKKTTRAA